MIPAGYMYKLVGTRPDYLAAHNVVDVFSAGACGGSPSPFFTDYIKYWKHNGYWFFNSPGVIKEIARMNDIDLSAMTLFYYEIYEYESADQDDEPGKVLMWSSFESEPSFATDVLIPEEKMIAGYDVVEYAARNSPECSLLTCCNLAGSFSVNSHCLFASFEEAKEALETGIFHAAEPGPYRIIAVYLV